MKHFDIFSTPISVTKAKKHKEVQEYIDTNIRPEYEKNGYNSDVCNVYSDYFSGAPKLDQKQFTDFYREDIEEFFVNFNMPSNYFWQIRPYFWYNFTGNGGWQEQHDHISAPLPITFSAIHYVNFDKDEHKAVEFINPIEQLIRAITPSENKDAVPDFFKNLASSPNFIEEGDIIFFPSYLKHSVPIQRSDKLRITVAMNIGIYNDDFIKVSPDA